MADEKTKPGQPDAASQQKIKEALSGDKSMLDDEEDFPKHPLQIELEAAQLKVQDNEDKCLRLQAEMQNLLRRVERDVANAHRYALEKFVDALIPIIDSLEHALDAMHNAVKPELTVYADGVVLTHKMFLDVLKKFNVNQLNPVGEVFNPEFHEAISMQQTNELPANTILAVVQRGYDLNGRIVRPARVVVAKAP